MHQLYAAPAYLAAHGTPRSLAELARHEGIVMRAVAGETRWELVGPKGAEHVDIAARLVGDHAQLVLDATLAGLGVALLPSFFGDPHVATGALAALLPRYSAESPLHVLTHASRHLPRRVALFRDHLADSLASTCKAHGALA